MPSSDIEGESKVEVGSQPSLFEGRSGTHPKPHEDARDRPLLVLPLKLVEDGEWSPRKASPWVSLFYDLVFVSILTVFSSSAEIEAPKAIANFFAFFVLVWHVWLTQFVYDAKYQSDDWYHRFAKLCQLTVFLYLGAASAGWNPAHLTLATDDVSEQAIENDAAQQSLYIVGIIYAVSRALLLVQYLVALYLATRAKRPRKALLISIGSCALCMATATASTCISFSTRALIIAKLVLLYGGMLVEWLGVLLESSHRSTVRAPVHDLTERCGALTLIILGEGFISVLRAFQYALSGFGATDRATYINVFCAIVVLFCLWSFHFDALSKESKRGRKRTTCWIFLHFPLHFMLLLLIAGIVNNVKIVAYFGGLSSAIERTQNALRDLANGASVSHFIESARQMNRLKLYPPWQDKIAFWNATISNPNASEAALNATASDAVRYLGEVNLAMAAVYDVRLSEDLAFGFAEFVADHPNATLAENLVETAHILGEALDETFVGVLWCFAAAGGSMLIGLLANYVRSGFRDYAQLAMGVAFCLLGIMSLGDQHIDLAADATDTSTYLRHAPPIYQLVERNGVLPVLAGAFAMVLLWDVGRSWWRRRRYRRVGT